MSEPVRTAGGIGLQRCLRIQNRRNIQSAFEIHFSKEGVRRKPGFRASHAGDLPPSRIHGDDRIPSFGSPSVAIIVCGLDRRFPQTLPATRTTTSPRRDLCSPRDTTQLQVAVLPHG